MMTSLPVRLLSLVLALAAGACQAGSTKPRAKDFVGRWTVTEIVGYADIGGGIPLAKTLLGRVMDISEKSLRFGEYQCEPHAGFSVRQVETAPYLEENAGAEPADVGLPAHVYLLHSEQCYPIFWIDQDKIEFDENGVFVRAQRTR